MATTMATTAMFYFSASDFWTRTAMDEEEALQATPRVYDPSLPPSFIPYFFIIILDLDTNRSYVAYFRCFVAVMKTHSLRIWRRTAWNIIVLVLLLLCPLQQEYVDDELTCVWRDGVRACVMRDACTLLSLFCLSVCVHSSKCNNNNNNNNNETNIVYTALHCTAQSTKRTIRIRWWWWWEFKNTQTHQQQKRRRRRRNGIRGFGQQHGGALWPHRLIVVIVVITMRKSSHRIASCD